MLRDRLKLLQSPYIAPSVRRGDTLLDLARGEFVTVGGYSSGPIAWPRKLKNGRAALIVCDELARAVREESEIAIAHHWGVNVGTVWAWRKALGVHPINPGTSRLYRDYQPIKLPEDVAASGREAAATKENYQRQSKRMTGVQAHPNTAAALRKSAARHKPKKHREAIGRSQKTYWLKKMPPIDNSLIAAVIEYQRSAPKPSRGVQWHSCEIALLGLGPDRVIAGILGRAKASATQKRERLGIKSFRDSRRTRD